MTINPEESRHLPVVITGAEMVDSIMISDLFIRSRAGMEYIDPNLHSKEETQDWIIGLLSDNKNTVLKAVSDDKIDGFCVLREVWLDHMYVDPDSQGRGIGNAMLHQAQSLQDELQLWVFQQNTDAIRLYERNGFTKAEETDGSGNEEQLPDARYVWRKPESAAN